MALTRASSSVLPEYWAIELKNGPKNVFLLAFKGDFWVKSASGKAKPKVA
jgi:hypothetical protein